MTMEAALGAQQPSGGRTMSNDGITNMPRVDYDRVGRVNWSTLKKLGRSPAHYRHSLLRRGDDDTDAMLLGRVVHLAVFEPERFSAQVVEYRDRRAGKDWEAFEREHVSKGVEVITSKMMVEARALQDAARSSRMAEPYLSGGRGEVTILWSHTEPEVGGLPAVVTPCKSRLDFVQKNALVDLKTTKDASPSGFGREAARLDYCAQAAFYRDAHTSVTGRELPYVLVAVEKVPPFVVQVYRLTPEQLDMGRQRYRELLGRLHLCMGESRWPGYADAEMDLTLPRWAAPDEEDSADELGLTFGGKET